MRILVAGLTAALCLAALPRALAVNGCDPATALDLRGPAGAQVAFQSFSYAPRCVRISEGATVTFNGTFPSHPLAGGTVVNGNASPAGSGPFFPTTSSGESKAFTIQDAGEYPYYCDNHFSFGMSGVVYVGDFGLPQNVIFANDFE